MSIGVFSFVCQAKRGDTMLRVGFVRRRWKAYHSHDIRTLWTYRRIHLPVPTPGKASIFCIRRAQLYSIQTKCLFLSAFAEDRGLVIASGDPVQLGRGPWMNAQTIHRSESRAYVMLPAKQHGTRRRDVAPKLRRITAS